MACVALIANPLWLTDNPLWLNDSVSHENHVRALADSNGDGISFELDTRPDWIERPSRDLADLVRALS